MESEGGMSGVQFETWQQVFPYAVPVRQGQDLAFTDATHSDEGAALLVLPTGYGKSKAAIGRYLIMRSRGLVNRMLWLVPTDALREQLVPSTPDNQNVAQDGQQFFRLPIKEAVAVEKVARDMLYHVRNKAEIFVATYQQVANRDGHFAELMDSANGKWKWLVVCDEAHHLSEDGKWGPAVQDLPFAKMLYMSATPMRTDRKILAGVPARQIEDDLWTYDAAVEISYIDALREEAIRQPKGQIQHYFVDVETGEGEQVRITTESLAAEGITDMSAYEAKRGLRYCTEYLCNIIGDSLGCLNSKLMHQPEQHQELVFAMSCGHAKIVAEHFDSIEAGCADWIGVTRSDKENRAVLDRFKANKLKVLVQVDKAGEGFDNPRCSVLVFLHLIRSETKLFQQLGRGLRRNSNLAFADDVLDVFASADTPVADQIKELEAQCKVYTNEEEEEGTDDTRDDPPRLYDIPDLMVLAAQWYRTDTVFPRDQTITPEEWMQRGAEAAGITVEQLALAMRYKPNAANSSMATPFTPSERVSLLQYQEQVNRASSVLTSNVMRLISPNGGCRPEWAGYIKKAIHTRWAMSHNTHKSMMAEDFKQKHEWLQELNREIKRNGIPRWLMPEGVTQWLR